jgi:hypothetical protein
MVEPRFQPCVAEDISPRPISVDKKNNLEFASSFFINSESGHGEEGGCEGEKREDRESANPTNRTQQTGARGPVPFLLTRQAAMERRAAAEVHIAVRPAFFFAKRGSLKLTARAMRQPPAPGRLAWCLLPRHWMAPWGDCGARVGAPCKAPSKNMTQVPGASREPTLCLADVVVPYGHHRSQHTTLGIHIRYVRICAGTNRNIKGLGQDVEGPCVDKP